MNELKTILHQVEMLHHEIDKHPPLQDAGLVQYVQLSANCLINALEEVLKTVRGERIDTEQVQEKLLWLQKNTTQPVTEPVKKSLEVQKSIWKQSLHPLLETLIERVKRFKSLFTEMSFMLVIDGVEQVVNSEDAIAAFERQFAHNDHLSSIKLMCSFRQALDPKTRIYSMYHVPLQVNLEKHIYVISSENRSARYQKSYLHQLTRQEINEIVAGAEQAIREKIEKQTVQ